MPFELCATCLFVCGETIPTALALGSVSRVSIAQLCITLHALVVGAFVAFVLDRKPFSPSHFCRFFVVKQAVFKTNILGAVKARGSGIRAVGEEVLGQEKLNAMQRARVGLTKSTTHAF